MPMSRRRPFKGRLKGRRQFLLVGLLLLLLALAADVVFREGMQRLSTQLQDAWQRAQPRAATLEPGVAVVDIDEASLARLGQWPWPRDRLGQMVDAIGRHGAAVIAFDMAFNEPDRTSVLAQAPRLRQRGIVIDPGIPAEQLDNDLAFAAAIARYPVVMGVALSNQTGHALAAPVAGIAHAGSDPRQYLPDYRGGLGNLPVLSEAASGIGSFSFPPAADNVIRQMPLVANAGNALYPGLAVEALRVAQGVPGLQLRSSDASGEHAGGRPGLLQVRVGMLDIPSQADGSVRIHYSGMPHMPVIPAWQLLESTPSPLLGQLEGRVVLVGTSAIGLRDIVATPLAAAVPGVQVHAELVDQAFNGQYLQRPDWARGAEVVVAFVLGLLLLLVMLPGRALPASLALLVLLAAVIGASWWGYSQRQWLLDPLPTVLSLLLLFTGMMPLLLFAGNREKRQVREAFGRYLSPTLVQRLAEDPDALRLGGESRDISVLFSDIRGFTGLSESLAPDALTALLNRFLTPMTEVLLAHEATIDKYIGDAIMAFWNAPLDIDQHPRKACLAALGMVEAVAALNAQRGSSLQIGIGIHSGLACVGNLGSLQRFSYSAIGDTVNLAARVEGLTKQYAVTVLVTDAVRAQVQDLALLELDRVQVVGRSEAVGLHALLGDAQMAASADFTAYREQHQQMIALYQQGQFAQARQALEPLMAQPWPGLGSFYTVLSQRLLELQQLPAGQWQGVHVASSK